MVTQRVQPPWKRDAQIFPKVSWEQFEDIEHSFESIPGVKFRYLDGILEIMTISPEHEDFKSTIRRLLEAYLEETNIRFYSRGGPSLGNKELGARSELDESYNLESRKPYPDLVIEVVISSGGVDKLEGYRRMGVVEVWFWEDGVLAIHRLRENGYEKLTSSELLPDLPLALFCRYITYHDQYDAVREFRQVLRQQNV
ncbi:MAG: Uma2 family endonuclease [Cyanobacteria bacterium CRU_2_1]|nr:Uma2 family endonuclease [Cyanobacteria bacterium CRU_2_1]